MSCPLCCETWGPRVQKTSCLYCEYEACQGCLKRYILGSNTEPKCMNPGCGKPWTNSHLFGMLPKQFIAGEYKKHREHVLADREMAFMADTQGHVEVVIRREQLDRELVVLQEQMSDIRRRIADNRYTHGTMRAGFVFTGAGPAAKVQQEFMGRCSSNECKGFVCAGNGTCGICQTKYCKHCMVVVRAGAEAGAEADAEHEHECKPDDIATCKLLRQDSKACPGCAAITFKISGCTQMFCTSCHVLWDWKTLEIQKDENRAHNPHYFTWRAANPVAAGPERGMCDGQAQVTLTALTAAVQKMYGPDRRYLLEVYRVNVHITHHEMRKYADDANIPLFDRNLDLRIKYLRNEISKEQFMSKVQIRAKAADKKREIRQILEAYVAVVYDILRSFILAREIERPRMVAGIRTQVKTLLDHICESFENVHKRYGCVVPDLREMMEEQF